MRAIILAARREYQAIEKPIICCSTGTSGSYISETKSGIVITPGDYELLAKSILSLKENIALSEKIGENERLYVENNLSIQKIGSEMRILFESLKPSISYRPPRRS